MATTATSASSSTYLNGVSDTAMTAMAAAPMMIIVPRSGCFMMRAATTPTVANNGTTKWLNLPSRWRFRSRMKARTMTSEIFASSEGWNRMPAISTQRVAPPAVSPTTRTLMSATMVRRNPGTASLR